MEALSIEQWKELDIIFAQIHRLETLLQLEEYLLEVLPSKLGATHASWNEHNAELLTVRVRSSNLYSERVNTLLPILNEVLPSHPGFKHFFDFEAGKVKLMDVVGRTLDFTSAGEYQAADFYKCVGSKLGIEDQLLVHLYIKNGNGALLVFQSDRAFTVSEHLMCCILRGHILTKLYLLSKKQVLLEKTSKEELHDLQDKLSQREYETVLQLCKGISNSEIADALSISIRTVEKHVSKILQKLELASRNQVISSYGGWM